MKQLKWTAAQQVLMLPGQLRHSTHSVLKDRFRRLDACWLVGEVTMDLQSQQQCWQTSWVYLGIQNKASRFAHWFFVLCWFCLVKAPNRIILLFRSASYHQESRWLAKNHQNAARTKKYHMRHSQLCHWCLPWSINEQTTSTWNLFVLFNK